MKIKSKIVLFWVFDWARCFPILGVAKIIWINWESKSRTANIATTVITRLTISIFLTWLFYTYIEWCRIYTRCNQHQSSKSLLALDCWDELLPIPTSCHKHIRMLSKALHLKKLFRNLQNCKQMLYMHILHSWLPKTKVLIASTSPFNVAIYA